MDGNVIEHLSNPIQAKILIEIYTHKQLTTKALIEKLPDISQPTIYRHIKTMLDDGILKVMSEKHIRGTVEKSYSVAVDLELNAKRIVKENDGKGYLQMFSQYIVGIMAEFKDYSEREAIDIMNDGSGFSLAPVYATTEELNAALKKVGEILMALCKNEQTEQRKLHNICVITTPPKI